MTSHTQNVNKGYSPIPSGRVNLCFIVRADAGNKRPLIVVFTIGDSGKKLAVYADEIELFSFPKFQLRVLGLREGVLCDHNAANGTQSGKARWYSEVVAAIKSGESDDNTLSGVRVLGGQA